MEYIIIFLILAITVFFVLSQKNCKVKKTGVKKEEIIMSYENDLRKILKKFEDNKPLQIEQKKKFLQNCNNELSRNIFFTEEEAIKIIQRLSLL